MEIELQQVLTQLAGFLIFLWLMKRFAWRPLLELLDERRRRIQAEFDESARIKTELAALEQAYAARWAEIESQARQRLQEAIQEGQRVGREIQEKARQDTAKTLERARQSFALEVETARARLQDEVVTLALMAAERVIQERLDEPKHRQLVADFIRQVERVK